MFPPIASLWRQLAEQLWEQLRVQMRVTCGLRSFTQQWDAWHQGRLRDKSGEWVICDISRVVTYAKPGESFHQYALAIDSCFSGQDPYLEKINPIESIALWSEYGRLAKKLGFVWGGDWRHSDRPHLEVGYGLEIHDLQVLYEDGGLKGVWNKCSSIINCGSKITL